MIEIVDKLWSIKIPSPYYYVDTELGVHFRAENCLFLNLTCAICILKIFP